MLRLWNAPGDSVLVSTGLTLPIQVKPLGFGKVIIVGLHSTVASK